MKGRVRFARGAKRSTNFLRPMTERRVGVIAESVIQDQCPQLWQIIIARSKRRQRGLPGRVKRRNIPSCF